MQPSPSIPNEEPESEVLKPDFTFIPTGRHIWRQEGPYLVCRECPLHHAVFIGIENLMVGEDENGRPILRSRSELNLAG